MTHEEKGKVNKDVGTEIRSEVTNRRAKSAEQKVENLLHYFSPPLGKMRRR